MLTTGPNLGLLDNGAYGEQSYFELLRLFRSLDTLVQPHVKSATTATPPTSPAEGDAYIVPANPIGLWAGKTGQIARWTARSSAGTPAGTPLWEFFVPQKGWLFGVDDTGIHLKYNGTTWYDFTDDAAAATAEDAAEAAASAAAALVSENNAADSEAAAAASAAAALISENNAADSETAAAASEAAAATSQTASAVSQSAAAASATSASSSATTATTQAGIATTQATTATTKASEASASATAAATSATNAASSATTATTQAGIATTKASEAASSAAALAASLEAFRTQSLGTFESDPTMDGNGDPLQEGAEYFNSVTDTLRIYVNGQWQDYDYSAQQSTAAAALSASNAAASAGTATAQANIATTQAGNAATSAAAASTSAGTASAQAAIATTQAETATTKAGEASASATAAATSATNASNSATTATTQATNASNSATAAATSATNASNSATTATTQAGTATSQASSAAGSATAAAASATTATNQAAAAAASALSAASVVDQDLSAIDKTVFAATIVDAFIYDTSKDSDGGAWRKRCSHTSWENETLSGNWLGSAANEAAARAISGATTGSYYYDTTATGFYTLNAGSGKTATYRGNVRQFPAKVLITVEAERVVLWDLTQADVPMWMVFLYNGSGYGMLGNIGSSSRVASSVAALNSTVCIGATGNNYAGAYLISFVSDSASERITLGIYRFPAGIQSRNSASLTYLLSSSSNPIVNDQVNDVAMTVLPNAPVDVATGLPVPTIAVATNGGVSVIQNDGTVTSKTITQLWSATLASSHRVWFIAFTKNKNLVFNYAYTSSGGHGEVAVADTALTVLARYGTDYTNTTSQLLSISVGTDISGLKTLSAAKHELALGLGTGVSVNTPSGSTGTGLGVIHYNPATPGSGLFAKITKDYTSGWLLGDIRGAWLADSVAETITTLFESDGTSTTGWSPGAPTTLSLTGTQIKATASTADGAYLGFGVSVQVGKTYRFTADVDNDGSSVAAKAYLGLAVGDADVYTDNLNGFIFGERSFDYTAGFTGTVYFWLYGITGGAGSYILVDSASARRLDVDRSVKAKGLQAFGSLTKAAVASGAQLMGYSGFSAANFLEQLYNSDLDFGTGDFCVMGWVKTDGDVAAAQTLFVRDASGGTASFLIDISATEVLKVGYLGGSFVTITATIPAVASFICVKRVSGVLYVLLNALQVGSMADTQNWTTKWASPITRFGLRAAGIYPADETTMALWRASATAPSDEQIKHIYETEKKLFEANANCLLAGSSNAVTALAYDDATDLLHVGTSYGRSAFKGLVRTASEATAIGAFTALSASGGFLAQGGASGADIYVPAYLLREELARKAEQAARLGASLEPQTFTATNAQTAFQLPVGWTPKFVYVNGLLRAFGATEDYTTSFDGFRWTVTLADASVTNDQVTVMGVRSNG